MHNLPLVTVYITTKNRKQLLERAIKSVLEQSWSNIEIIVCDDCSNDGTQDLLAQYEMSQRDGVLFNWFTNLSSLGASVSRNKAIKMASGDFITGLDDDDYFLPDRISSLYSAYKREYAFVCSTFFRNTEDDFKEVKDGCGVLTLNELLHYNKVGNQIFIETERLRLLNGFDEMFPAFQDYDMWVVLLSKYQKCLKIDVPTYVQDISHDNSRISSNLEKVTTGFDMFLNKHKGLMSKEHLSSMELLRYISHRKELPLYKALRLCNRNNYKSIINKLIRRKAR